MESRLTDLEIRLTHQEAALQEMNEVLLKQHSMLQSMSADLAALQRQLRDITASNIADAAEETPPPHY